MTFEEQLTNLPPLPESHHSPEPLPDWLEDENLLRDEAAVLGLSDAQPDEQTTLIRLYFQRQTIQLERKLEYYSEKMGELNLFIEQKASRIAELRHKTVRLEASRPDGESQFLRTGVGLMLAVILLVGNYYLIEETLRPHFPQNRLIAIGVFLAGMFGLYSRETTVKGTPTAVDIRQLLVDTGLPFATSLFIFIQALQSQPVINAVGLFIFIFFLFLSAGRLLPGLLTALRNDISYWHQGKKLEKERKTKTEEWENEINLLTISIDAIRLQKSEMLPCLNRVETELHRINTQRDLLIHLFENEFQLARSLRNQLSTRQRRAIAEH